MNIWKALMAKWPQCERGYRRYWDATGYEQCIRPRWHFGHHTTDSGMTFRRDLGMNCLYCMGREEGYDTACGACLHRMLTSACSSEGGGRG